MVDATFGCQHGFMEISSGDRVKQIVAGFAPAMKEADFRRKGTAFNRRTPSGIVQVLSTQLEKWVPAWPADPAADEEERRRQTFTVNVSLWIPALAAEEAPVWVREYDGQVRLRLPRLIDPPATDGWWPVHDPATAGLVHDAVVGRALPWFDRVRSPEGVLAEFERHGGPFLGWTYLAGLRAARLYADRGERDAAERVASDLVTTTAINPIHRSWLVEQLEGYGLDHLVPLITTSAP